MPSQVITLIAVSAVMFLVIGGLAFISHYYTLDGIKSKTVGDGQHGTARWATKQEIRQTYAHIPFEPELWRKGEHLPEKQGLILGCEGPKNHVTALVDTDDIHAMVTAASGAGKTAFFLYPNIEYALASGMSFLCTDTKGDLYRNYAGIAKDFYGYQIAVLDLRRNGSFQRDERILCFQFKNDFSGVHVHANSHSRNEVPDTFLLNQLHDTIAEFLL